LDVVGDINIVGSLRKNGVVNNDFSQFSVVESNVYINSNIRIGIGLSNPQSALQVAGHITPGTNLAYDLGSSNMRWRDLFLSGNTINIASTKLSIDNSNNLTVRSARDNKLRKIVVDEIQLGLGTSNDIIMRADDQGAVRFFKKNNDVIDEIVDDTGVVNTAVSLSSNLLPTFSTSNSYIPNAVSVPTLTTSFVPSSADLSFGRIRINGHNGVALSNGGEITLSVSHNLGTSNYMVFSTPENARLQASFCNFLPNSFIAVVRNQSGGIIANPVVNYMLVKSPLQTSTALIASPPIISVAESNMIVYSGTGSSNTRTINYSGVNDNIGLNFDIRFNASGRFSTASSNIIYNLSKTNNTSTVVFAASNAYFLNSNLITLNVTETFLNNIGLSNTYNVSFSNSSSGTPIIYSLPGNDQNLPLTYIYNSNVGGYASSNPSITGSNLRFFANGYTSTYTLYLSASFVNQIMMDAALQSKALSIVVNETGNSIITNGLRVLLDAKNPSSYNGSGSTWTDLMGNANATLFGSPTWNSSGYLEFNTSVANQYGLIPSVTGVTDYTLTQSYTVSCWVYINNTQVNTTNTDHSIVEKWNHNVGYPYAIRYIRTDNTVFSGIYNGSQGFTTTTSAQSIPRTTWIHLTTVYEPSQGRINIYLNGVNIRSATGSINGTTNNSAGVGLMTRYLGVSSQINHLSGRLGMVMIYNRALSASEVLENFNGTRASYGV